MRNGEENGPVNVHVESRIAPCWHTIRGDEVRRICMHSNGNEVLMIRRHDFQHMSKSHRLKLLCWRAITGLREKNANFRDLQDVLHLKWAVSQHETHEDVQKAGLNMSQQLGHRLCRRWLKNEDGDEDGVENDNFNGDWYSGWDNWNPSRL